MTKSTIFSQFHAKVPNPKPITQSNIPKVIKNRFILELIVIVRPFSGSLCLEQSGGHLLGELSSCAVLYFACCLHCFPFPFGCLAQDVEFDRIGSWSLPFHLHHKYRAGPFQGSFSVIKNEIYAAKSGDLVWYLKKNPDHQAILNKANKSKMWYFF